MPSGFRTGVLLLLLALMGASPAMAAADPAGRWAFHAGGKTLLILELRSGPGGTWRGALERPTRMRMTDKAFHAIEGPVVRRKARGAASSPDGLELIVEGVRPGDTDLYVFRVSDDGFGELGFKGVPMQPWILVRAAAGEKVAETWDPARRYSQDWDYPSNPEMARLFEADQAARADPAGIDRVRLRSEDARRRAETKALLDSGKLRSGDDFYHAAFVFQHGDQADDYLMAHVLATVAVARGRPDATWIAAATLDRYLQRIGRKQVFGTQFITPDGGVTTQEPYDRILVSDALRAALGVRSQAEQEKQRAEMAARFRAGP